jgi:hypothetical protein
MPMWSARSWRPEVSSSVFGRSSGRSSAIAASLRRKPAPPRIETPPDKQLQIDFSERMVVIGDAKPKVFLFVALGYSRRLYGRAFRNERQESWFDGLESAFVDSTGSPRRCCSIIRARWCWPKTPPPARWCSMDKELIPLPSTGLPSAGCALSRAHQRQDRKRCRF